MLHCVESSGGVFGRHSRRSHTGASLFPDRHNEDSFFVEAPRKIFAHLLSFHPTPQELVWWMSHSEEIDRRVKGTEYAAMIDRDSPPQRNGVLGSLSMVADAIRLLPSEAETKGRWSTLEWAKQRHGWLFLTSTPDTRKRLALLILRELAGTCPVSALIAHQVEHGKQTRNARRPMHICVSIGM